MAETPNEMTHQDRDIVLQQLNARMGIEEAVRFEAGAGGLIRAVLTVNDSEVHVYRHGAHVTHFQPTGYDPVLFVSDASQFESGKAIRGGVPICFPWFADHVPDPAGENAPMHGFARTSFWKFRTVERADDGGVRVVLALKSTSATRQLWPHHFVATHTVMLSGDGGELSMALWVKHKGPADASPFTFEQALHTYLRVGDIQRTTVTGLDGARYIDKVDGLAQKTQAAEPIGFSSETDRVYVNTKSTCVIHDDAGDRQIVIEKQGSESTIVWNPWKDKAGRMGDFGDQDWLGMVCVETGNVGVNSVTLRPGESHTMRALIHVQTS